MASTVMQSDLPQATRELVLRAMARAKPTPTPDEWLDVLTRLIVQRDSDLLAAAVSTVLDLPPLEQPPEDLDRAVRAVAEKCPIAERNSCSSVVDRLGAGPQHSSGPLRSASEQLV